MATTSGRETNDYELIPATCAEALRRWDAGESVFSVEMGGLGPGYEQCIQIVAFEALRELLAQPAPPPWEDKDAMKAFHDGIDKTLMERTKDMGLSGAQYGAGLSMAYRCFRIGYGHALAEVPDRHIQVSNNWPKLPEAQR